MKYLIILILMSVISFSQEIEKILNSSDTDSLKVLKLNEIGRNSNVINEIRQSALDSAFTLSHRSIFHYGKALTYLSKAHFALDRDSLMKAVDFFTLSTIGFGDLKLPIESAEAQFKLALTYESLGLLDRANNTYKNLLKNYEKVGTKVGHVYFQLSNNYKQLGKEDSSKIYSSKIKKNEVNIVAYSHTFSEEQKRQFQSDFEKRDLLNEIEKAKFRTDIIAFLFGILLLIAIMTIIYLIFKVRSLSKN